MFKGMSPTVLSGQLLQQVSECIEDRLGLHFPPTRYADLERCLVQAALADAGTPVHAYVESLLNCGFHAADLEALASHLTIGETHFFRDAHGTELLQSELLPELIAARRGGSRRLRLWSAGCATGEEPYSLAILLHRLIPDLADWNVTVLGTDINSQSLARAATGIYTEWSFRGTPAWVKARYFTPLPDGRYEVHPWLKRMVTLGHVNLAADDYPSPLSNTNAMDLIVCRNVLLYFALPRIPQVVRRFHQSLIDGGQLLLGAVEAGQLHFPGFVAVHSPWVAWFRKAGLPAEGEGPSPNETGNHPWHADAPATAWTSEPSPLPVPAAPAGQPTPQSLYAAGFYHEACELMLAEPTAARRTLASATLIAQCYANLGELAEALTWCERALAITKSDSSTHFLHASILRELGRDEDALQSLRNVLFLEPEHVFAHFATANLHRRCNRLPAATKHLTRVSQLLAGRDERDELPQAGGLTVGQLTSMLETAASITTPADGIADE
jgi:chemotaxis protein methyltransferase CheR